MKEKILITGGAGFIGREVVKQLLDLKYAIVILDNFSFGRQKNISEFLQNSLFKCIKEDINNYENISQIIRNEKPTSIIHLAALHYIPFCNSHPLDTIETNVNATFNLLKASSDNNVKKVLFASSGAIYASRDFSLKEDVEVPEPVDIYGLSKLLGEKICEYFSKISDCTITAMRFFNTYGPYETNEHLIPEIIKQIKNNNYKLKLGNIKTKRDYIYVEDIAKAIVELANTQITNKYQAVNIGTGLEFSAEQIISRISKIMNKDIQVMIDKNRLRNADKMHQIASLDSIQTILGWVPRYGIDEGLKKLLIFEKLLE